jgi:hypothetical protein
MKSRQFSKISVKTALSLFFACAFLSSCTSSTEPTFARENIEKSIKEICKQEYSIDTTVKLVGKTIWIYVPVEDMLEKMEKPEKYTEKFDIMNNDVTFEERSFRLDYAIKAIPEKEKVQEYKYNKKVLEKLNNVWKVIRRVMFSLKKGDKDEPQFFVLVIADIKSGFEMKEVFFYTDLKKVSYSNISWGEYQHRAVSDTDVSEVIIGDKTGEHLSYKDITMDEFLALQIQHRIKLKFQKPEVTKNADIDKEVAKIVATTVKTYDLKDFDLVELNNMLTDAKSTLNRAAVRAQSHD